MTAPSVLLVDDGELDPIQAMLERLRVDWVRCLEPDGTIQLERPRDLIISSGPRATRMPAMRGDEMPIWICIYDRDFLPLREQLAVLGVHYLVSRELGPRALELFVRQLLHRGDERRRDRRIPFACEVEVEVGMERRKAQLLELSSDGCVLATDEAIPPERRVAVRMPASLTGDEPIVVAGSVLRSAGAARGGIERGVVTVLRFGALGLGAMAAIQRTLSGDAPGSEVSPVGSEPERERAASEPPEEDAGERQNAEACRNESRPGRGERRGATRHAYTRCIDTVRWQGTPTPEIVFGRDLSVTGLRISAPSPPAVGSEVALALYGGAREEPVLVEARVVRIEGEEVGLCFRSLGPAQRRSLERLVTGAPRLERLAGVGGALCVAELVER